MIDALRYEYVRLRTIGSTYGLIGAALVFQLVFAVLIALSLASSSTFGGGDETFQILATIGGSTGAPLLMAYIVGLLGVFSTGHEYRHGMIRATLTAIPNRTHVFVAKVVSTIVTKLLQNPGRDASWMREVTGATERYVEAGGAFPPSVGSHPELVHARWMLEEFRLSLFAQELGTAETVSLQRITKALTAASR